MWKQILTKVNEALLTHWSQFVWFVLGTLIGIFFLAGLVSCTAIQPAWEGVKGVTDTAVTTTENVVTDVYQGAKSAIVTGVEAVEGTVEGAYDVVTDPFTGEDNEE